MNSKGYGKLTLNGTETGKTFFLDSMVMHKGQFQCMEEGVKGSRLLLRFDVVINNLSNDSAIFYPYDNPLQLHYRLSDVTLGNYSKTGYFNISCIRDTFCYGLDEGNSNEMSTFYYACVHSGMSRNCQQRVYGTGDCRWIDITGLDILHLYNVTLNLVNPASPGAVRGSVDSTPWSTVISLRTIQRNTEPSSFKLISSILLFSGTPVIALIFSRFYVNQHRYERKQATVKKKKNS